MLRSSIVTAALALVCALTTTALVTTNVARAGDDDKYPTSWKGEWVRVVHRDVEVQGAFDQTKPWGRGQQAPLTEEYRKVHEASMEDQKNGGLGNYPTATCRPSGMAIQFGTWHEGTGKWEGNEMHLTQTNRRPDGSQSILRIRYYDITPQHFRWSSERSEDGGKTWKPGTRIEAKRAK